MLRYAVVGAGGFARKHIGSIREYGPEVGCELAAVAIRPRDRQPGQVEQFAAEGVDVFADAVEMFIGLAGKVDGVFVPTGIYTHADLTCAALAHGHNVYVEKPPAATVQEIDRMLAAVAESGKVCALGFQAIYSESVNFVKQRVVDGSLGEIRRLKAWALWPRPDAYYGRNEWAGRMRVGDAWVLDGPANNALSHQIANMLYLASGAPRTFATPATVRAEMYHARDIDGEDTCSIQIATADAAEAWFIASHCVAGEHVGPWIEIEGAAGRATWNYRGQTKIEYADGRTETPGEHAPRAAPAPLANFSEAVRAGDPSLLKCDLTMGRNFTLAVNGAWESSLGSRAIDPRFIRRAGDGPEAVTVIEAIDELVPRCAAEWKHFSEIGAEWGAATEPFDMTGYSEFPARFRPEA